MESSKCLPKYKIVDGVYVPQMFSTDCVLSAINYEPKENDIIIATYQKCGTTWMQNIMLNLLRKGKPLDDPQDFFMISPFMDMIGTDIIDIMPRPGAIKTHLPFSKIKYSDKAKYIYVARNPKDCCTSYYHHCKNLRGYDFSNGNFDDFFELFMSGKIEYNDYFDHLLGWYAHKDDPNVFFVTYEEMKKDTKNVILELAKFIGEEYVDLLEKNPDILDKVLYYSSFRYMKENLNPIFSLYENPPIELLDMPAVPEGIKHIIKFATSLKSPPSQGKLQFVRKGEVRDWKNLFSEEQSKRLDEKFAEKAKGTGLETIWKDYM